MLLMASSRTLSPSLTKSLAWKCVEKSTIFIERESKLSRHPRQPLFMPRMAWRLYLWADWLSGISGMSSIGSRWIPRIQSNGRAFSNIWMHALKNHVHHPTLVILSGQPQICPLRLLQVLLRLPEVPWMHWGPWLSTHLLRKRRILPPQISMTGWSGESTQTLPASLWPILSWIPRRTALLGVRPRPPRPCWPCRPWKPWVIYTRQSSAFICESWSESCRSSAQKQKRTHASTSSWMLWMSALTRKFRSFWLGFAPLTLCEGLPELSYFLLILTWVLPWKLPLMLFCCCVFVCFSLTPFLGGPISAD